MTLGMMRPGELAVGFLFHLSTLLFFLLAPSDPHPLPCFMTDLVGPLQKPIELSRSAVLTENGGYEEMEALVMANIKRLKAAAQMSTSPSEEASGTGLQANSCTYAARP